MMRDDVFIQEVVGRADTMLPQHARSFDVMGDFWHTLVNGADNLHPQQSARFTTTQTYVVAVSAW